MDPNDPNVRALMNARRMIDAKRAEMMNEHNKMQKGLDKFSRLNVKAYMTLLD